MSNLLRADFIRLFKSRIFMIGIIFMFLFSTFTVYSKWLDIQDFPEIYSSPDGILFSGTEFICIVIAIVVGIFIGTDYSDGTIRNKLVIGHSRASIYCSNLITCTIASLIIHAVWLLVIVGAAEIGLTRKFDLPAETIATEIMISLFSVSAITALILLICMLVKSKSTGVVTVMILSLAMILSAMHIYSSINESEYTNAFDFIDIDENGNMFEAHQPEEKNPYYLTGMNRRVYELLYDSLPSCQIRQLSIGDALGDEGQPLEKMKSFPLYSLVIIVVTTTMGIIIFRKKDLK